MNYLEFLEEVVFKYKTNFIDHFFEEIKIRLDNGQSKLLVLIIFIYKFLKHFRKL